MFGRATITLGIGPHSSFLCNINKCVSCNFLTFLMTGHVPKLGPEITITTLMIMSFLDNNIKQSIPKLSSTLTII